MTQAKKNQIYNEIFTIEHNILTIQFGKSVLQLNSNGHIELKNEHSQISLTKEGHMNLNGMAITQEALQDIKLESHGSIHLNS